MRKLLLFSIFIVFTLNAFAQAQGSNKEWFASIGLNAINSQGTRSPIGQMGDWATNIPISGAIELRWTSGFAIEQSITLNKFSKGETIDGIVLTEDFSYLSFDTHAKYYFGKHIFPDTDWIDFYGNAGIGFFKIDNTNVSANIGGGVLFWLNRRQTFGIRTQVIGKFALDHSENLYDNNHYQFHLQAIFAL